MNNGVCPICGKSSEFSVLHEIENGKRRILVCNCGHQLISPMPTEEELDKIYGEEYYTSWGVKEEFQQLFGLRLRTCKRLIKLADKYLSASQNTRRHLDIGCAYGYMLEAAQQHGYESQGLEISHAADEALRLGYAVQKMSLEDAAFPDEYFDLITGVDIIEHIPDPRKWLKECGSILKKGGLLVLVTPNCESLPARVRKNKWPHYHIEHLHYYSPRTIEKLLNESGFDFITVGKAVKYFSLEYLTSQYGKFQSEAAETKFLNILRRLSPQSLFKYPLPFPSGMIAVGRKK